MMRKPKDRVKGRQLQRAKPTAEIEKLNPAPGIEKSDPAEEAPESKTNLHPIEGMQSKIVMLRFINQAKTVKVWVSAQETEFEKLVIASKEIAELKPANATEAMLAVQMLATHETSLGFLKFALGQDQTSEARDANVHRAARLMRIFLDQVAAMERLKGKAGQQKVTVEHVHVNAGGQAIVGAVTAGKGNQGGGGNAES